MSRKDPVIIWDGVSGDVKRTHANSMMIANQQKRNLEEVILNKGVVDQGMLNRVQNNTPSVIKELIEKANLKT